MILGTLKSRLSFCAIVALTACGDPGGGIDTLAVDCAGPPSTQNLAWSVVARVSLPSVLRKCPGALRQPGSTTAYTVLYVLPSKHGGSYTEVHSIQATASAWRRRFSTTTFLDADTAYTWDNSSIPIEGEYPVGTILALDLDILTGLPHGASEIDSVAYRIPTIISYDGSYVASMWLRVPFGVDTLNGTILGPVANVVPGTTNAYRVQSLWDSSGYRYQWFVNNTPISGATGATFHYTFSDFGTYPLRVDVMGSDDSVRTTSVNVSAPFGGSIVGPSSLEPFEEYSWSANIPFGHPPYTYEWQVDGTTIGTGTSMSHIFNDPGSSHSVILTVDDSQSRTFTTSLGVSVSTGNCNPFCTLTSPFSKKSVSDPGKVPSVRR